MIRDFEELKYTYTTYENLHQLIVGSFGWPSEDERVGSSLDPYQLNLFHKLNIFL